jgi:hypothetical protein
MAKNGRTVSQRDDGQWANQKDGGMRASNLHNTQAQATKAARAALRSEGGGELKVKDGNGRIRLKDTVPPARDPNPPRG